MRTNVVGFTELGILQLTRKKVRNSIGSTLTMPCEVCEGTGKMIDSKTAAFQIERVIWEHRGAEEEAIWIETRSDVINEMKAQGFLNALEKMVKKPYILRQAMIIQTHLFCVNWGRMSRSKKGLCFYIKF
ncbi:hypothetical protein AAAC51_01785 [Priestia megaterium]